MVRFTHIQDDKAQMVDITAKGEVSREARATGRIYLRPGTLAGDKGRDSCQGKCTCHSKGCSNAGGERDAAAHPHVS